VSTPRSRYASDRPPDYSHRFHAGNVGDVWKHCALLEVLRRAAAGAVRLRYLESHAGEGDYPLAPTGEWTEGVGRLWDRPERGEAGGPLGRYIGLCRRLGGGGARPAVYPGSPALASATLAAEAELFLWERDAAAHARLAARLGGDPRVRVERGDGLAALSGAVARAESERAAVVVLVDPPYGEKADWIAVPDAFVAAARGSRHACLVLWYPVKSLTRPNAMLARLEAGGVQGVALELVTTPLELRRNRLNGCGLVLVRPPAGAVASLAATAPAIGGACATVAGVWSLRIRSFRPSGRS